MNLRSSRAYYKKGTRLLVIVNYYQNNFDVYVGARFDREMLANAFESKLTIEVSN